MVTTNLLPRDSDGRVIHDAASVEVSHLNNRHCQHFCAEIFTIIDWAANITFEGVEDAAEQDKKPERDGPRGASSKVMVMMIFIMIMNVMDQGNGGRSSIVEKMPILLTSVTIEMVLVRIRY